MATPTQGPTAGPIHISAQWSGPQNTLHQPLKSESTARSRAAGTSHDSIKECSASNNRQYQTQINDSATGQTNSTPREITAFLDSDSGLEEGLSDVVQRAETARVCRPKLVHHRNPTTGGTEEIYEDAQSSVKQTRTEQLRKLSDSGKRSCPVDNKNKNIIRDDSCPPSPCGSLSDSILEASISDEGDARGSEMVYSPIRSRPGVRRSRHNPIPTREASLQSHLTQFYVRASTRGAVSSSRIYNQTGNATNEGGDKRPREHSQSNITTTPYPSSRYAALSICGDNEKGPYTPWEGSKTGDLVITLCLTGHRHRTYPAIIRIPTNYHGRFDDFALFKQLRKSYHRHLLPVWKRWLNVRSLDRVFLVTSSPGDKHSPENHGLFENGVVGMQGIEPFGFDANSFLRHLQYPKLGVGNTNWLEWFRQHQELFALDSRPRFSILNSADGVELTRHGNHYNSHFSTHSGRTRPSNDGEHFLCEERTAKQPKAMIQLQHLLSPTLLSFAIVFILLLSITATVLWITLGPGTPVQRPQIPNPPPTSLGFQYAPSSRGDRHFKVSLDIDQACQSRGDFLLARVPAGFLVGFVVVTFGVVGLLGWLGVAVVAWRRSTA